MSNTTHEPMIALHRLSKAFGAVAAVREVSLAVPEGAFLALLGPSGCGKTTILRMLAGLEAPSSGAIHVGGQLIASGERGTVVAPGRRNAGLVFQSYALWPHMTVRQNVEWPLAVQRWSAAERRARADEVLALLEIGHLAARYPGAISGGQQQRVAIARTIAPRPQILLFDEPLSNLDARLRAEMRTELLRVHRATGATSVYVTHDQVEAMTMATHVAVMREGRLEQFGPPRALLEAPATRYVAGFVGTPPANLIRATVVGERYRLGTLDLGPAADTSAGSAWLMYRPDALELHAAPTPRSIPVEFAEATPMAGRAVVTVWDGERRRLSVVTERLPEARLGDRLFLSFPAQPAQVFVDEAVATAAGVAL